MAKKINIKGTIIASDVQWVYDWLGMEATSPKVVSGQLDEANGEKIEVEISSPGGNIFAASEIYTALKAYPGKVTVKIVALAASAAGVIAMAGDTVLMSPTAHFMLHNVNGRAEGDYREMEHMAETLRIANQTIINAYKLKTGMDDQALQELMDKETWMTPQQALEHKFIDEIMFQDGDLQLVAAFGAVMLPDAVIDKIKNLIDDNPQGSRPRKETEADFLMARLSLLKLKGEDISG